MEKNRTLIENRDLLRDILERDLYVSVLKDGSYGSYLPIPIDFLHNIPKRTPGVGTLISNKNLQYIGINVDDETLTKEKHEVGLGNIDYAGVNENNEVLVGLAKMDRDTCDLIPDPVLHWKIPQRWSIEDGCTIPHAYTSAYYILVYKAKLEHGDTVLIHNGCSAMGLALISVALSYGCTVFTTIANHEQKGFIRRRFATVCRIILANLEFLKIFPDCGEEHHEQPEFRI